MTGDPFKKVSTGDKVRIPASTFNGFVDAARGHREREKYGAGTSAPIVAQSGIILIRNDTGGDLDRFSIVGLANPVITPTDNLQRFKNGVAMTTATPAIPTYIGKIAIVQEPVKDGKFGRALVSGVTPVKVDIIHNTMHPCADLVHGQTGYLESCQLGNARMLWHASGIGEQWAVVQLSDSPTERGFWAEITAINSLGGNKWKYSYAEAYKNTAGYGGWAAISGGKTGYAWNTYEDINTGSGTEGNGVDLADLKDPEYLPVPVGTPVWLHEAITGAGGTEMLFHFTNEVLGDDNRSLSSSSSSSA